MNAMLKMSQLIDGLNERIGRNLMWLVLFAVIISAGNAVVRQACLLYPSPRPRDRTRYRLPSFSLKKKPTTTRTTTSGSKSIQSTTL